MALPYHTMNAFVQRPPAYRKIVSCQEVFDGKWQQMMYSHAFATGSDRLKVFSLHGENYLCRTFGNNVPGQTFTGLVQ